MGKVMIANLKPTWVQYVLARSELTQSQAAATNAPEVMNPSLKDFFDDLNDVASFLVARANYMWALMPELLSGVDRVTTTDYGFALYTLGRDHECKGMIMAHGKYINDEEPCIIE